MLKTVEIFGQSSDLTRWLVGFPREQATARSPFGRGCMCSALDGLFFLLSLFYELQFLLKLDTALPCVDRVNAPFYFFTGE